MRGWLLLLAIYVGYLLLGAFLFHLAECPAEVAELEEREAADAHLTLKLRALLARLEEGDRRVLGEIMEHWRDRGFVMVDTRTQPSRSHNHFKPVLTIASASTS